MGNIAYIMCVALFFCFHQSSGSMLDRFLAESSSCEILCEKTFSSAELEKSCREGCRLFIVVSLTRSLPAANKTTLLCKEACTEAFINETIVKGCFYGCQQDTLAKYRETTQSLHLLTPLFYVKGAYNTVFNRMKQYVSSSWTVYVQEDSGRMIVFEQRPKVVESSDYNLFRDQSNEQKWQEEKSDWMDCISRQSGIPRWLLVIVLFGFIIALLWLCCAAAVTAPNQILSTGMKKTDVNSYVFLCEPDDVKCLLNLDEEAPPLPPKVTLI